MFLPALEHSLQQWLRNELPLPAQVGEVSFETPDGTWGAAVSRPTVNLFLFEVLPRSGPATVLPPERDGDGTLVERTPAPQVSFSYLASAWAGGVRDEHLLLGDFLRVLLGTRVLPSQYRGEGLVGPVDLAAGDSTVARVKDVWGGIDGHLRAGVVLVVTTIVPVGPARPVAPEVLTIDGTTIGAWRHPTRSAKEAVEHPTDPQGLPDRGATATPPAQNTPDANADPTTGHRRPAAHPTRRPDGVSWRVG